MPRQNYIRTPRYISQQLQKKSQTQRIRIPQPTAKAIHMEQRDVVRWRLLKNRPLEYVLHRRGPKRERVGEDPLEAMAVPKDQVTGTLPERIVYKFLTERLHLIEGPDFSFQSSLQGGRQSLGGIVVDFLFEIKKFAIQVQGPTHTDPLRVRKDDEQKMILAEMGYQVYEIDDVTCYNPYALEEWMRRVFDLAGYMGGGGGAFGNYGPEITIDFISTTALEMTTPYQTTVTVPELDQTDMDQVFDIFMDIRVGLEKAVWRI